MGVTSVKDKGRKQDLAGIQPRSTESQDARQRGPIPVLCDWKPSANYTPRKLFLERRPLGHLQGHQVRWHHNCTCQEAQPIFPSKCGDQSCDWKVNSVEFAWCQRCDPSTHACPHKAPVLCLCPVCPPQAAEALRFFLLVT